jgi:hypothetical protein
MTAIPCMASYPGHMLIGKDLVALHLDCAAASPQILNT